MALVLLPAAGGAEVPFPACDADAGCSDPTDYGSYLFHDPDLVFDAEPGERVPDDFDPGGGGAWKYLPDTGTNVIEAWARSTGRPDVVVAVLDSGIRWRAGDLARKAALNVDELPVPAGCAPAPSAGASPFDCDGNGVVNVEDFAGQACPGGVVDDANGNGLLDAQDLILRCSDGVDGFGGGPEAARPNGFVDDICGWDFFQDDNDPFDDTDYGHGTGQAIDSVGEANNGGGFPGVAPSAMFLPLRVGDSFVGVEQDFSPAVVYAVDVGALVIQEALGLINQSDSGQAAIDYAYERGIPLMASAADEESRHHNYPAAFDHTIWLNSILDADGTIARTEEPRRFDVLNGCTNYGGHAWVTISSSACSSEATGRGAGLAALLVSHGRNLVDAGLLEAFDAERGAPFSAEEVRQLFRVAAEDIDYADDLTLGIDPLVQSLLSRPDLGLTFGSSRFPTQAGWDQFTGFGRPDALALLEAAEGPVPPEADLAGGPTWFDVIDPAIRPEVEIVGSAAARRNDGWVDVSVQVGCGVQPEEYEEIGNVQSVAGFRREPLAVWDPAATALACGFDPSSAAELESDPDAHTVTLRLVVRDRDGTLGIDRRSVAVHSDPSLRFAPRLLPSSGEASPVLADVDRNGVLDVVFGTGGGSIHVVDGRTGRDLPGFPVWTEPLAVHPSPAWAPEGPVPVPHEGIIAAMAADDVDGDGRVELLAAGTEGRVYLMNDQGETLPGFPVSTDPARSLPENRDRFNDADPGIFAAPTLADLDGDGDLELLVSAADGHLYVWHHDGSAESGFPVRIADRERLDVDPDTGRVAPRQGSQAKSRLTKLVGSPAVGDLDGDGSPEIVVTSNEEYGGGPAFGTDSTLVQLLLSGLVDIGGDIDVDTAGRVYAVQREGENAPGGPFRPGWPVELPMAVSQLLPNVATGTPGSPALADLDPADGSSALDVAIFGAIGPLLLFDADGEPSLGRDGAGRPNATAVDFPGGGFAGSGVPESVGSPDGPFFAALGSSAFGDLDGDGAPELIAPTGGIRKLIDVIAPARQGFGDHQITVWNPRDGSLFDPDGAGPSFPRVMDDMQFLSSPGVADVGGDAGPEVLQSSGVYLVRAYSADGSTPEGWPKFTHGWAIASPTAGDVDGDGRIEVVTLTREGRLFVWDTPALSTPESVVWQGFGGDRRNSGNLESGAPRRALPSTGLDGLLWDLRSAKAALADLRQDDALGRGLDRRLRMAQRWIGRAIRDLEAGRLWWGLLDLLSALWALALPGEAGEATEPIRAQIVWGVVEAFLRG